MYAVIKTGGKQYRVQPGDVLVVEKLDGDVGAAVKFDQVMMLGGADGGVTVGAPLIEGAFVSATLIETRRGKKVKIFKKIRRQGYRRTNGHRQSESVLRVIGLDGAGQSMKWDGEVDLTPRSVIDARARGLAPKVEAPDTAAQPVVAKAVAPKPAKIEAPVAETPAAAAPTPAVETEAAAPKKAAAPKAKAEAKPKAETGPAEPKPKAEPKAKAAKAEAAPAAGAEPAPTKAKSAPKASDPAE